jgi:hypothetical protein
MTASKPKLLNSVVRPDVVVQLTLVFPFGMPFLLGFASVAGVLTTRAAAPWSLDHLQPPLWPNRF